MRAMHGGKKESAMNITTGRERADLFDVKVGKRADLLDLEIFKARHDFDLAVQFFCDVLALVAAQCAKA